jgi:polyhydroxyalkanoate synthesis regulator phasin
VGEPLNSSLQRYLDAVSGVTEMTRSRAEQVVKQLVRSGEAAGDQVGDLVDDLIDRQRKNREAVSELVRNETVRAVHTMGLATTKEVDRLQKQVADLKRELGRVERDAASSADVAAIAAAPAKKATAKKTSKKATKKATAKKASKKATAKKATKKATAKKATAKKTAKKATRKSTGSSS